jgi:hypothetical protein
VNSLISDIDLMRFRSLAIAGLLAAAIGFSASPAFGAVTIGSSLANAPDNEFNCSATNECTDMLATLSPLFAATGGVTSPISGVVVHWKIRVGTLYTGEVRFRVIRPNGSGQYTGAGTSDPKTPPLSATTSYDVRMPIQAGDYIGIECCGPNGYIRAYRNLSSGQGSHSYWGSTTPPLADGGSYRSPEGTNQPYELMIAADIEADVDADGFGDETQDQCPAANGPYNGCPSGTPPDKTSPVLSAYALSPSAFRAAASGPSVIAAKRGTTVTYKLSEAAAVKFTVERKTRGRKIGKRCRKARHSNRGGRRCTRYVTVNGSFDQPGKPGPNSFRFSGRLNGSKLRRGNYRLVAVASDAAGNKSSPRRHPFRIIR